MDVCVDVVELGVTGGGGASAHLSVVLYDGIILRLWVWYLNSDEHRSLQRLTAHVIPADKMFSFLSIFSL